MTDQQKALKELMDKYDETKQMVSEFFPQMREEITHEVMDDAIERIIS